MCGGVICWCNSFGRDKELSWKNNSCFIPLHLGDKRNRVVLIYELECIENDKTSRSDIHWSIPAIIDWKYGVPLLVLQKDLVC